MSNNNGWSCPRCHKIYSPAVVECNGCNSQRLTQTIGTIPANPFIAPYIAPIAPKENYGWCNICSCYKANGHLCHGIKYTRITEL